MDVLRVTLDSWRDMVSLTTPEGQAPGDTLTGSAAVDPSVTGPVVDSTGGIHQNTRDILEVDALPWSADLLDPTDCQPTAWGYRVTLSVRGAKPITCILTPERIAATPPVDGVRIMRLEDWAALGGALSPGVVTAGPAAEAAAVAVGAGEAAVTAAGQAATAATTATSAAGQAAGSATAAAGSATAAATSAAAAAQSATTATAAATSAANNATAAQEARTGAETARDSAVTARTGAETAQTGAAAAEAGAEASAVAAAGSAADAETAQSGAVSARQAAESARDTASGHAATATTRASETAASAATAVAARDATLAAVVITGEGRPDVPATMTSAVQALVAAATSGAEFRSLDGPQGAWVWRKRGTTWVCVEGDTGWVDMAAYMPPDWVTPGSGSPGIFARRTAEGLRFTVRLQLAAGSGRIGQARSGATTLLSAPPEAWRPSVLSSYRPSGVADVATTSAVLGFVNPTSLSIYSGTGTWAAGNVVNGTAAVEPFSQWPLTLTI